MCTDFGSGPLVSENVIRAFAHTYDALFGKLKLTLVALYVAFPSSPFWGPAK